MNNNQYEKNLIRGSPKQSTITGSFSWINFQLKKMIIEVLLILLLYLILFFIWWRFRKCKKDNGWRWKYIKRWWLFCWYCWSTKGRLVQHKKREWLKSVISKGKTYLLGSKWTHEGIDKANDETINKTYAEYKQRELNEKGEITGRP